MKKLIMLSTLLLLAACGHSNDDDQINYRCGTQKIEARYMEETVVAIIDNRHIQMQHVRSADGVKFQALSDPSLVFWNKGSDATLFLGQQSIACKED